MDNSALKHRNKQNGMCRAGPRPIMNIENFINYRNFLAYKKFAFCFADCRLDVVIGRLD